MSSSAPSDSPSTTDALSAGPGERAGEGAARRTRRFRVAALLALFAFALAFQGSRAIWDPDEGRYLNVALTMIKTGDWWTPRLNYDTPHLSKPPLTYWAVGASIWTLGRNEWAARLPNAAAWCGTVLLAFGLARRLAPGKEGLAAVVQATALFPFVAANVVTTDTLLAFFEALGVWGFVRARWDSDDGRSAAGVRRGIFWMWTGFGLAFLTKGPPGLLPLAAIVAFLVATEGFRGLGRLRHGPAVALFFLLAFGWYASQVALQPHLLSYLLGQEVVGRLTAKSFNRNAGLAGIWRAYAPVLAAGLLPWSPWAAWTGWKRARAAGLTAEGRTLETRFLFWWILLPLTVFLVSTSRLPLYLLPLALPGVLLCVRALPADALAPLGRRVALVAWIAFLLVTKLVASEVRSDRDGRRLARDLMAILPSEPLEVVTINRKPHYSLSFYLDVELEPVALDEDAAMESDPSFSLRQTLAEEIAEDEPSVIYLVPPLAAEAYRHEVERLGWISRRLGDLEDLVVFQALRQPGAPVAEPARSASGPSAETR